MRDVGSIAGFPIILSDDAPPPRATLEEVQALGRAIIDAVDARERIVNDRHLDQAFCMPDANWRQAAGNDYYLLYRLISRLQWDQIKELRLRCSVFTGHMLPYLPTLTGTSSVAPIAPDFYRRTWDPNYILASTTNWRAVIDGAPAEYLFQPPLVLGECGWRVGDKLVNPDIVSIQERISLMHEAGVFGHMRSHAPAGPRILEIGGGHGGLALALKRILNPRQYVICDLPESMLISGLYLSFVQEAPVRLVGNDDSAPTAGEIALLPNYLFETLGGQFDLVINTLSMSEMTAHQVSTYAPWISRLLRRDGLFYEQNKDNRHVGFISCKELLEPHFPFSIDLSRSTKYPLSQGAPHLRGHHAVLEAAN